MVVILDRLYEERMIENIVVVFVDPWDNERRTNRREQELIPKSATECTFCDFMLEELIPEVARNYPTSNDPTKRGLLGASYGGLHAAFMGLEHGEHFGMIGMQSSAFHSYAVRHVFERLMKTEQFPKKVFVDVGLYEKLFFWDSKQAALHLRKIGANVLYVEVSEGHSWGHWRATIDDALIHFFGKRAD